MRLFALGILVQASFGLGALIVVRWGFRSWPQGSYTWIPGLITVAGLVVLVWLGRLLSAKGLSFGLIVAAWYLGRVAGALASKALPGVGFDSSLLDAASFGALAIEDGRLGFGTPSLVAALLPVAVLAAGYVWGRCGQVRAGDGPG